MIEAVESSLYCAQKHVRMQSTVALISFSCEYPVSQVFWPLFTQEYGVAATIPDAFIYFFHRRATEAQINLPIDHSSVTEELVQEPYK